MQNLKKHLFIYIIGLALFLTILLVFIRSGKYKTMCNIKRRHIATSDLSALSYGLIKESPINVEYIISILENRNVPNAQLLKNEKTLYKKTFSNGQSFIDAEVTEGIYYILEGSILVKIKTNKPGSSDLSIGDCVARPNNDQWMEVSRD